MFSAKSKLNGSRRDFLRAGMYAVGVSAGLPAVFERLALARADKALADNEKHPERILVVVELSGGNDGLNTVVPYGDDAYYQARPKIGIAKNQVLKLDDHFGFHPACEGLHRMFKAGNVAIAHGCGYPNPNLSHFTSMEYWHTAVPQSGDKYGWLGRFADASQPRPIENWIVNIAPRQSRAVASAKHSPVVFKDPQRFGRIGTDAEQKVFETFGKVYPSGNASLDWVNSVSRTATVGASLVRSACSEYRSQVDYGSSNDLTVDLKRVAGMIAAGLPTRIFYLSLGGFDTHAAQASSQQLLLIYLSDALAGFVDDLQRIGRGKDVAIMVFTEFGRRVRENASRGTDHGTATPMFVIGKSVKGGFYGKFPSLVDLDDGNLKMTVDFRSVYATMLNGWMGFEDTHSVLKGDFPVLPIFG